MQKYLFCSKMKTKSLQIRRRGRVGMKKVLYSSDGAKIVFDVEGNGELLVLLHGAGGERKIWEKYGWIEELKKYYTVAAVDI